MNYSADKPIVSKDEDLLGRSTFSNKLAKAIYEYNDDSGLVIGLFGKWGTGKTSVINMAEEELLRLSKTDDNKPLIVKFSPWNYSNQDNLISLFFHSLNNKLQNSNNEKLKGKIGDFLKNYADAVDGLAVIPAIGPVLAPILKTILKVKGDKLTKAPDLEESKDELKNALSDISSKIVVVIDDIDRLNNSQIRDIFQLVKQVGDFPNVIYVLLMDREVVSSALKEVHNIDGNEYLDKIIQVPFEIPDISKEKLYEILREKLESIYTKLRIKMKIDQIYMSYVLDNCVYPYVKTLRDVNRIINIFQFKYGALCEETAFDDMLALTTIEVKEPKLYNWVYDNKDNVCGGFNHAFNKLNDKDFNYRSFYENEFSTMGINSNAAMNFLRTIFPTFADDINEHVYNYVSKDYTRAGMRISHEEKFDLYFSFDIDAVQVSRKIIDESIYDYDKEQLIKTIKNINKSGEIRYYLEELKSLTEYVPNDRLHLLSSVMLSLIGEFKDEKRDEIFSLSANNLIYCILNDFFKRFSDSLEGYEIIKSSLEKADKDSIGEFAIIINRIELSYARLVGTSEKEYDQIISIDKLENLENVYVKKVKEILKDELISDINEFYMALYLWECFDKESAYKYLNNLFKDDINKIKFICSMAEKWTNTDNEMGWSFSSNRYEKYISSEEVYELIKKLDKMKLEKFTNLEKLKIAAFYLSYKNGRLYDVSLEKAQELLKDWEHQSKEGCAIK